MDPRAALQQITKKASAEIASAATLPALEAVRVGYLGKKGKITAILKSVGELATSERPEMGRIANEARVLVEAKIAERHAELTRKAVAAKIAIEADDITLPGRKPRAGRVNIITRTMDEIVDVFIGLGYEVAEGPEIESDYYNFEALNMPPDHPARSLWDTLYVSENVLLRTHTSPVQVRVMEKRQPPLYILSPGRVYRHDTPDASHAAMFHQVEGFVVDEGITFGDLKGTLEAFAHATFGEGRPIRLRPSFFPFTEPSAEVDVQCFMCGGAGCRICGHNGWIEILGCGMIDPNVLEGVGIDFEKYTGFAFGMGVERIAMLKYGVADIRLFLENDMRFLKQF